MSRGMMAFIGMAVLFIAWTTVTEMKAASVRAENAVLLDSIARVDSVLETIDDRRIAAETRTEQVETQYAQDSLDWQAERDSLREEAVADEAEHTALGDSIRSRVDEETRQLLDTQDRIHERIVAGRDSIIESQAEQITSLNVRVAEWMVRSQTAEEGWDLEKEARAQEATRTALWEAEAQRLGNPSLVTKIIDGLPWLAAGYLGAKISP